jgi:hypothetical protein
LTLAGFTALTGLAAAFLTAVLVVAGLAAAFLTTGFLAAGRLVAGFLTAGFFAAGALAGALAGAVLAARDLTAAWTMVFCAVVLIVCSFVNQENKQFISFNLKHLVSYMSWFRHKLKRPIGFGP